MANWHHYEPYTTGLTCIIDRDRDIDCPFEIGSITTGRQRVFHRYYVKVIAPDGHEAIGISGIETLCLDDRRRGSVEKLVMHIIRAFLDTEQIADVSEPFEFMRRSQFHDLLNRMQHTG